MKDLEIGRLSWIIQVKPKSLQAFLKEQRQRYNHRGRGRESFEVVTLVTLLALKAGSRGMQAAAAGQDGKQILP